MDTVGRIPATHGAATRDHFANQLFCVQGKDWLAGSSWNGAGNCQGGNSIACIIEGKDIVLQKRFSSEVV
jgi:hypothetical protein